MPPPPPKHRFSRREFLGLAGLAALAGGLAGVGGLGGYLTLKQIARRDEHLAAVPTATAAPRLISLKQIERPPIQARVDWNARAPDHEAENESGFYSLENPEGWREYDADLRAVYRTVIVHHSAFYDNDDVTTIRNIQDQHMDLRGWADIAYHFGVGRSGIVFEGRALTVRGTHVENFNTGSAGVVFLGDFEKAVPTPEQIEIGRSLIDWLALRLELTHLAGHRDFNDFTDCPGRNLYVHLEMFALSAGLLLGTGGYSPSEEQVLQITPAP